MTLLTHCAPHRPPTDDALADAVVEALLAEAALTPKPALVDARGGGAHPDMDLALMSRSALALRETFRGFATLGRAGLGDRRLRAELARAGRRGEQVMLAATAGVNTHRGAIWALGLVIAAAAASPGAPPRALLSAAARIAHHPDPAANPTDTPGSRARARYRVGGALGEARAGFPHGLAALRELRRCRAVGHDEDTARLNALLVAMSGLEDTCLLARGGPAALAHARTGAAGVLAAGGTGTPAGAHALRRLEQTLLRLGVSPGGSADMLALALFVDTVSPAGTTEG